MLRRLTAGSETLRQAGLAKRKFMPTLQILIAMAVLLLVHVLKILWDVLAVTLIDNETRLYEPLSLIACGLEIVLPVLFCVCVEKRSIRSIGCCRKWLKEYVIGFAVGAVMICAAAAIAAACGALSFRLQEGVVGTWFALYFVGFLIQGAGEEFFYRGYLMISLTNRTTLAMAVGISSVIFSLMHIGNGGITVLAIVNLALYGMFAGIYMLRRDNIWSVCAFHSAWNFFQGNVLGVNVSGENLGSKLFVASMDGNALISGGSFGLEGGIAVSVVLAAAIALVLFLPETSKK